MENILLSVIMPVYNVETWLDSTIQNILLQKYMKHLNDSQSSNRITYTYVYQKESQQAPPRKEEKQMKDDELLLLWGVKYAKMIGIQKYELICVNYLDKQVLRMSDAAYKTCKEKYAVEIVNQQMRTVMGY